MTGLFLVILCFVGFVEASLIFLVLEALFPVIEVLLMFSFNLKFTNIGFAYFPILLA